MNDRLLDEAELASRVARSLHRIADTHQPRLAGNIDSFRRPRTDRRSWLFGAAACLIVAVGVVSLVVAQQRNGGGVAPADSTALSPVSAPGNTNRPENSQVSEATVPTLAPTADSFRFDEPLADGVLSGLVPAPSGRGAALDTGRSSFEYLTRFEIVVTIAVLDIDGTAFRFLSVVDMSIPPDALADADIRTVGTTRNVVDESDPQA
jgi:hypothetical protein